MLKIEKINIHYNKDIIIDANLAIPDSSITVIKGVSGSGKSSLLRQVILEEQFFDYYMLSGIEVNDDNIDDLKKSYLSFMDQQATLIEDLRIIDHFELMHDLYHRDDAQWLIEQLDLKQVLSKYPNQLSGGEKTRVALVLCILKDTPVIVMDEPTSSLDSYYTDIVIKIIKKLSADHMVIVASHDEVLFEQADYIYEIENQQLNLIKGEVIVQDEYPVQAVRTDKKVNLGKYMVKMKKHHLTANVIMTLLISLSIAIASVGIYFGLNQMSNSYASLEELYNNEINIYKPIFEDTKSYYSANGHENHFTQEEYDKIKKIDGLKEIYPHLELGYRGANYLIDDERRHKMDNDYDFSIYYQGDLVTSLDLLKVCETNINDISLISYNDKNNYDDYIETKYNDTGIYLSKEFAKLFGLENIKQGATLRFELLIPTYKESGDLLISLGDDGQDVPGYPALCVSEAVELPIVGVLKGMDMGTWSRSNDVGLYVPLSYYQEMINAHLSGEIDTYYYVDEISGFKRDVSDNEMILETVTAIPWQPDCYTVKLDSIENYETILEELEKQGYVWMSGIALSDTINDYAYNISDTFIIFSIALLLVISLINFVLKFINRDGDYSLGKYFKQLGYSSKQSKRVLNKRYRINCYLTIMPAITFIFLYYGYAFISKNYLVPFKLIYLIFIVVLSWLIEYLFPKLFLRGEQK